MAINQNHLFEELDGVKCAIVEKNAAAVRVDFLRSLLTWNGYTVVVIPSPPPKSTAPAAAPAQAPVAVNPMVDPPAIPTAAPAESIPATAPPAAAPPVPETYTVGVTDLTFNPTNAIFGRILRTPEGHIVTLAYWRQKEKESHDEVPYFEISGE